MEWLIAIIYLITQFECIVQKDYFERVVLEITPYYFQNKMQPQKSGLNRREFISTMTIAAGFLTFKLGLSHQPARYNPQKMLKVGKRVGISDKTYKPGFPKQTSQANVIDL